MKKGFFSTAVLLASIMTLYYSSIGQNLLIEKMRNTEERVKMNQLTQEKKYRFTQGFKDTVKQSLEDTKDMKPEKRELLTCLKIREWIEEVRGEYPVKLEAGYIDPWNYQEKEITTLAFDSITGALRKDPSQALGELRPKAITCMNYISIKEDDKAVVKNNGYIEGQITDLIGSEPSFIFETRVGKAKEKIIIPSNTVIESGDK